MTAPPRALHALVPLLASALEAERIARDVAAAQARLAPSPQLQRALRHQSRQEAMHAAIFASALACLPSGACPPALARVLADFRRRLQEDVGENRLAASLFGLQQVLEGLGHVALQPPEGDLAGLGDRFVPLRGVLAQQELGHRLLGAVWMPRLVARQGAAERRAFAQASQGYLDLAEEAADAGLQACIAFVSERQHYQHATRTSLDGWRAELQAALERPAWAQPLRCP